LAQSETAFVQGKYLFNSSRLLQDLIELVDMKNEEAEIIFLEQMNAFKIIEWKWLAKCLDKFEFGVNFREWVKTLLNNAKTRIITNCFISKDVTISRSTRQRCPIAPMIYILQAEPLTSTIRANPNIKSIKLPHTSDQKDEANLNIFTDDTQLCNRDEESIEETFIVLYIYEKAPTTNINLNKTVGIHLGRWKIKSPKVKQTKWAKYHVKDLGVIHGHNVYKFSF